MNDTSAPPTALRRWLRRGLPLLVLAAALAGAAALVKTAPKTQRQLPPPQARLVETLPVALGSHATVVSAMGTVLAAQQSTLAPQVNGVVAELAPQLLPGGLFARGDLLLRLDDTDLRLALQQKAAAVAQAEAALAEELGRQRVARHEYELLGQSLASEDAALVLREPQLAAARATLANARAVLEQARLDLARARVTAPFAGSVVSRQVDVGTRVTPTTPLLTLLSTDEFWLQVSVPLEQLPWLHIPTRTGEPGSVARLHNDAAWPAGSGREGRVLRLLPTLDGQARMAQVLIRIPDPMALTAAHRGQPPVLVNDYLRAEIAGRALDNSVRLPRELLRDGDKVWLLAADDTLEIRPVHVAFRGRDSVLIDAGLAAGERLITSNLATPVAGMALRTAAADTAPRPTGGHRPAAQGKAP